MATTIDTLLRLVPDSPGSVLAHLSSDASLASSADFSGYTLVHAAASYGQFELLRALVGRFAVSVDIRDLEGETPLFAADTIAAVRVLVEELHADWRVVSGEGLTALENAKAQIEDGGEWAAIVAYLEEVKLNSGNATSVADGATGEAPGSSVDGADAQHGVLPVQLPPNVKITTGTIQAPDAMGEDDAPDPEFRRRIEELAARDDFEGEEGQSALRDLVRDAVGDLATTENDRDVRRRLG